MDYLNFKCFRKLAFISPRLFQSSLFLSSSLILTANAVPAYGVQIDFSSSSGNLTNSNSNNQGATMTYEDAIVDGSTTLDLIVEVVDSYEEGFDGQGNSQLGKNGSISSDIGQININSSSSTRFKFKLVEANTFNPYTIGSLDFSLLDVDGNTSSGGAKEKVILYSAADYTIVDGTPYLEITESSSGDFVTFTATNNQVTNPNSSTTPNVSSDVDSDNALTAEQEQHAINFTYNNVSEFEIGYEIVGGNSSRNFFYTGEVFFDETTETVAFEPVPFEFSPSLGLLLSGASLLGLKLLKKNKKLPNVAE